MGDLIVFEQTGEWCLLLDLEMHSSPRVGHVSQIATNWAYEDDVAVWTVQWGGLTKSQTHLLDSGLVTSGNLVNGNTLKNIFATRGTRDGTVVTISGVVYGGIYARQI